MLLSKRLWLHDYLYKRYTKEKRWSRTHGLQSLYSHHMQQTSFACDSALLLYFYLMVLLLAALSRIHKSQAVPLPLPCHDPAILRTRVVRQHAVSGRPMLIRTYHAIPMPRCAVASKGRFPNGMGTARSWRGMACVNQTWPHCVNQMRKTQSKPLAERHGRGTAWYV
jgi:hypothetical protein